MAKGPTVPKLTAKADKKPTKRQIQPPTPKAGRDTAKAQMPPGVAQAGLQEALGGPLATEGKAADQAAFGGTQYGYGTLPSSTDDTKAAPATTKGAQVIDLISREQGATLREIMDATGWQAHTVRGFLSTGPRKQGMGVERRPRDDGSKAYHLQQALQVEQTEGASAGSEGDEG